MPGYKTHTVTLESNVSGWYVGNILFGGLIGMLIVDPITGAMYTLSPQNVDGALEKTATSSADGALRVALIQDLTSAQLEKLVKIGG
jgi:hypothetical protein